MGGESLTYAIRPRAVLKHVGALSLVLAALIALPLVVALAIGDAPAAWRYALACAVLGAAGFACSRLPQPHRLQVNEGMAIVAAIFVVAPLAMTYPLMAAGLSWDDALFEAVSGVTTTGLTTVGDPAAHGPTFLFARAWLQWCGGLGIVALSLAFVVRPGLDARRLAEGAGAADDLVGSARVHARRVALVYCGLTALAVGALWATGLAPGRALLYALAAVSTGGFAPDAGSLADAGGRATGLVVTAACVAGATPFGLYAWRARRRDAAPGDLLQLAVLIGLGAATGAALALLSGSLRAGDGARLFDLALLAFSAQTTAGFSTLDVAALDAASKSALLPAMLVGGGVGSTAGGFKLLRLLVLVRMVQVALARARATRHAVIDVRIAHRRVDERGVNDALVLVLLYVVVVAGSSLVFVAAGYPPLDSLFEVTSATGTVGLTAGVTDSALPLPLKGVLCADMLLGRLEIVCWLAVLHPSSWTGRRLATS